jgi:hypothetical protein
VQADSRAEVGESFLERWDRVRHDGILAVSVVVLARIECTVDLIGELGQGRFRTLLDQVVGDSDPEEVEDLVPPFE